MFIETQERASLISLAGSKLGFNGVHLPIQPRELLVVTCQNRTILIDGNVRKAIY